MKRNALLLLLFISLGTQAQKITLKKGQQITITTTSSQDVDMSAMGMQMKSSSASTSILDVKDAGNENFVTSYKLSKVNLTMDMMGQQTTYDSEKPEDKDSDIGKAASEKINKEVTVLVNKNTGKASLEDKPASPEKPEEASPLEGLMGSFGAATEDATVETAFFIIPAGKKTGDTWVDSSVKEKMKEVKTYTLKSIDNTTATVGLSSVLEGSSSIETQGMQMDVTISSKTTGDILVDPKTFLVKKRINNTDLTGSIEMMGQSMPLTSKAAVTIDYL